MVLVGYGTLPKLENARIPLALLKPVCKRNHPHFSGHLRIGYVVQQFEANLKALVRLVCRIWDSGYWIRVQVRAGVSKDLGDSGPGLQVLKVPGFWESVTVL